ncbi:MAG: AAA family ATPase [Candidatus Diapherotrites archaeon]|nr:AAA family ATPase [Candidatus Diapherotrites archaeon]
MVDRVPTGIPGLDDLISGGFPRNSNILVVGGPGTGKTIFALQYIYAGASLYSEPGVFITLEEPATNIVWNLQNFGWDYHSVADSMKIFRVRVSSPQKFRENWEKEVENIVGLVTKIEAARVAIDSLTALVKYLGAVPLVGDATRGIWAYDPSSVDFYLYHLLDKLKELGVTTVLTSGAPDERMRFSTFGVEEFIADGVIRLYFIPPHRAIFIRKMRGTRHSNRVHPLAITEKGIQVYSHDEILWEALR